MSRETHRCAICAAEFGDSKKLVEHEHSEHRQHADSADKSGRASVQEQTERSRQNREFSRRNFE